MCAVVSFGKIAACTWTGHVVDEKLFLLEQAARSRRLAKQVLDAKAEEALLSLAAEYEERAAALDRRALAAAAQTLEPSV